MHITDLDGKKIVVTDLEAAIVQSEMFMGFTHTDANPQQVLADEERKRYWTDMNQKLLQLQSKNNS